MTLQEALAELGLEAGADPDAVRRAYLRLIKVRKPETDPQGFKRAREAYEIARPESQLQAFAAQVELRYEVEAPPMKVVFANRAGPAPPVPEPAAAEPLAPESPAAEASPAAPELPAPAPFAPELPAPEARAPEPPVPEAQALRPPAAEASAPEAPAPEPAAVTVESFLAEWHSAPPLDRFKKLKIARAAVAALPGDRRAHWLLVTSLSGFMHDSQLAQALRDGYRAGFEEFLEALLIRLPAAATRAEVDAALASPTASVRLRGAAVCAGWDVERSAAFVVEQCAQAHAGDPTRLPVGPLMDVVFALHEVDAVPQAMRAHEAVRRVLRENELELRLLRGDLGVVWAIAEELASLPDDFPERLRRAFAAASRAGDLRVAFWDAFDVVRIDRDRVVRWSKRLPGAPTVAGVLRSAVAEYAAWTGYSLRSIIRSTWYLLLVPVLTVVVIVVVRACVLRSHNP